MEDLERDYCVPGCLLGIFSCNLPRGPCVNIAFIIQTGKLPKPCLNPEPQCANAQRFVRMRQEEGLGGREMESKQVMGRRRWKGKAAETQDKEGTSESSGRAVRRKGVQTANSDLRDPQISPG